MAPVKDVSQMHMGFRSELPALWSDRFRGDQHSDIRFDSKSKIAMSETHSRLTRSGDCPTDKKLQVVLALFPELWKSPIDQRRKSMTSDTAGSKLHDGYGGPDEGTRRSTPW